MSLTLHDFFNTEAIDITETSMVISFLAFPTELFTTFVDKAVIPSSFHGCFFNSRVKLATRLKKETARNDDSISGRNSLFHWKQGLR